MALQNRILISIVIGFFFGVFLHFNLKDSNLTESTLKKVLEFTGGLILSLSIFIDTAKKSTGKELIK